MRLFRTFLRTVEQAGDQVGGLISKEIIGQTPRTAQTIANEMDADLDRLSETLDRAVQSGELSREVMYQVPLDELELADDQE